MSRPFLCLYDRAAKLTARHQSPRDASERAFPNWRGVRLRAKAQLKSALSPLAVFVPAHWGRQIDEQMHASICRFERAKPAKPEAVTP
jgi:hypothetical protein